jgi:hypothetical protein
VSTLRFVCIGCRFKRTTDGVISLLSRGHFLCSRSASWVAGAVGLPAGACPAFSGQRRVPDARQAEARSRHRSMKAPGDAAAFMFEHAAVVTSTMAVIIDRQTAPIVSAVIREHDPAAPTRSSCPVAPAVVSKEPDRDSHGEANSESHHQAGRGRHHIAKVGGKGRPPEAPGIVIGNLTRAGLTGTIMIAPLST